MNKTHWGFVNDHSGSMASLANAAMADYNVNIKAVKDAATREELDTIVSVVGIGIGNGGYGVERQVVISNPHVLKPLTSWPTPGGTPLYDGIGEMIELFESLPDARMPNVSYVVMITTDGEERHSREYNQFTLGRKITALQATGRWTFVGRVPVGFRSELQGLGIPDGNIIEWETTAEGMAKSTAATQAAVNSFSAMRSAGKTSSTVFYASASAVDTGKLVELVEGKDVSLYVVPSEDNGIEIRPFILRHRMEYLKGSAFYQLTKTEPRVQPTKMIAVRDRNTGKIYAGADAREMLGLPDDRNVRLHPGDHGNFDIFIQSESVNRKLVSGTGVIYWKAIGKPFTEADLAYLQPKADKPQVVQLPAVPVTNKPTPNPASSKAAKAPSQAAHIAQQAASWPVLKPVPIMPSDGGRVRYHTAPVGAKFYDTRDMARAHAMVQGKKAYDAGPTASKGQRFFVA